MGCSTPRHPLSKGCGTPWNPLGMGCSTPWYFHCRGCSTPWWHPCGSIEGGSAFTVNINNDEFSNTFMEQCTLDAIGVLIISTAAGGGVLGLKTWYLVFQVQVHLSYASVYLDLDSRYLSGVGQVHLPPLWHFYQNVCLNRLSIASGHPQIEPS